MIFSQFFFLKQVMIHVSTIHFASIPNNIYLVLINICYAFFLLKDKKVNSLSEEKIQIFVPTTLVENSHFKKANNFSGK